MLGDSHPGQGNKPSYRFFFLSSFRVVKRLIVLAWASDLREESLNLRVMRKTATVKSNYQNSFLAKSP